MQHAETQGHKQTLPHTDRDTRSDDTGKSTACGLMDCSEHRHKTHTNAHTNRKVHRLRTHVHMDVNAGKHPHLETQTCRSTDTVKTCAHAYALAKRLTNTIAQ